MYYFIHLDFKSDKDFSFKLFAKNKGNYPSDTNCDYAFNLSIDANEVFDQFLFRNSLSLLEETLSQNLFILTSLSLYFHWLILINYLSNLNFQEKRLSIRLPRKIKKFFKMYIIRMINRSLKTFREFSKREERLTKN